MPNDLQQQFNDVSFTKARYEKLKAGLETAYGHVGFRVCETPVFLDAALVDDMVRGSREILAQLVDNPAYMKLTDAIIPESFRSPNEPARPSFVAVDFAIAADANGKLTPKLVELQAGSSMYAYSALLSEAYKEAYGLGDEYGFLPGGGDGAAFFEKLRQEVVGGHNPENVVLVDIEPEHQKFHMDFEAMEKKLGIRIVGVDDVIRKDNRLYYREGDRDVRIERIYNRMIPEEFIESGAQARAAFKLTDDLDVEWAGHPNWNYRISKFSLPHITHAMAPRAMFLDQLGKYPADLSKYVLKPLFSFSGHGVKIDVTKEDLDAVPPEKRGNYILMEKIDYAPFIPDPDGSHAKAEVRMMFFYSGKTPEPAIMWGRVTKGKLAGVGFNRDGTWIGGAPVLFTAGGKGKPFTAPAR